MLESVAAREKHITELFRYTLLGVARDGEMLERWTIRWQMMYGKVYRSVLANGALQWVDVGGTVLPFDLANERLSVIPSPPIYEPGEFYHLVVLGDCLWAIYMHQKEGVWLFKQTNDNHGRPWNKEFSLGRKAPIASTKSGRLLCYGPVSGSIYLNDLKASSSELLENFSRSVCIMIPHRNTLISLKELGETDTQRMESVEREKVARRCTLHHAVTTASTK